MRKCIRHHRIFQLKKVNNVQVLLCLLFDNHIFNLRCFKVAATEDMILLNVAKLVQDIVSICLLVPKSANSTSSNFTYMIKLQQYHGHIFLVASKYVGGAWKHILSNCLGNLLDSPNTNRLFNFLPTLYRSYKIHLVYPKLFFYLSVKTSRDSFKIVPAQIRKMAWLKCRNQMVGLYDCMIFEHTT